MQLTAAIDHLERHLELDEPYRPSSQFGFIQIDDETILVTRGAGTTHITVHRGKAGTTAASHASGATVSVPTSTHTHPSYLTGD